MNPKDVIKNILNDLRIELLDEFDRNFERKGFFNTEKWDKRLKEDKGTLMQRTGRLRRSVRAKSTDNSIIFTSSEVYAKIQNEGGKIKVTAKMKKFFWAMYYEASGKVTIRKDGTARHTKRNESLNKEAMFWKHMALKRVGSVIEIKQRKFIGEPPGLKQMIDKIAAENIKEAFADRMKNIK